MRNTPELQILEKIAAHRFKGQSPRVRNTPQLIGAEPSGRNFNRLNRRFTKILFDGDIIVSDRLLHAVVGKSERSQRSRKRRWAYRDFFYPHTIWKTGVPYEFDTDLPTAARESLIRAMEFWQNNTCVTFRPRTNEKQYVFFTGALNMCASTVGRDTSQPQQPLYIGKGCHAFGVTSHEVGHVIGLFHHHQRYDRSMYVDFVQGNVAESHWLNFFTISSDFLDTYGLPYDVGSVMHYAPTEFAVNPAFPSLLTLNKNLQGTMGQMEGPSFLDVEIINRHYRCTAACNTISLKCLNGGYADPLNCSICRCPTGFGGDFCQLIASSAPLRCGGLLPASSKLTQLRLNMTISPIRRQCVYHIRSPPNSRVMIGIQQVKGKCQEGCYTSAVEIKMNGDFRPMGFRYCCESQSLRQLVSSGRNVPLIFFAQNGTLDVVMEFKWVALSQDAEDTTYLNSTKLVEVYKQTDDYGMEMELLQLPEGSGMEAFGGIADDSSFSHMKTLDEPTNSKFYGSNGESYEDFSVYT